MDYNEYLLSQGLDPSYFGGDTSSTTSTPAAPASGSANSGVNWTNVLGSGLTSGGNIFSQVLKNQAAGNLLGAQTKLAKANAASSSSMMTIVIIGVIGLAIVGVIFAFLGKREG